MVLPPLKYTSTPDHTLATTNLTTTDTDTTTKEYTKRWLRNLSSTPLTEAQVSLLLHDPNFTVAPRHCPMGTTSLQSSKLA